MTSSEFKRSHRIDLEALHHDALGLGPESAGTWGRLPAGV